MNTTDNHAAPSLSRRTGEGRGEGSSAPTMPERPATLAAQIRWLQEGKRKAVLVTPGEALPEIPKGCYAHFISPYGLFIYDVRYTSFREIVIAADANRIGELLGYGIPAKPAAGTEIGAVTVRDANGREKQAVVTDAVSLDAVRSAALNVADPDDDVRLESSASVVESRRSDTPAPSSGALPLLRPLRDEEDLRRLQAAAKEEGHEVLAPTFLVEKAGEIVGYVAYNSLPLCHGWLAGRKLRARDTALVFNQVENLARFNRATMLLTLVATDSPLHDAMKGLGYRPGKPCILHMKGL